MGKAVPKGIKSRVEILFNRFPEKFSKDFDKNKDTLRELKVPLTKKNLNLLSGFMVRKVKEVEKEKAELSGNKEKEAV